MDSEQVEMFRSITGASEEVAHDKLQVHRGDLNAAINSFFNEGEPILPVQSREVDRSHWMEENEPPRQFTVPFPSYSPQIPPPWAGGLPHAEGFGGASTGDPQFPFRETIISHPREEPRMRQGGGPLVEEALESEDAHLPSRSPSGFVSDEEEVSGPASAVLTDGAHFDRVVSDYPFGNAHGNAALINEVPAMAHNEGADIEEEMIRAAIEASRKETSREGGIGATMGEGGMHTDDDDMAWAVSQSLKTAEQEKAMRKRLVHPGSPEKEIGCTESKTNHDATNRMGFFEESETTMTSSVRPGYSVLDTPVGQVNAITTDPLEDADELEEQPLFRRRSGRRLNPTITPSLAEDRPTLVGAHQGPSLSTGVVAYPSSPSERNRDVTRNDEWGGLSSAEQEEAVMLEAAMFGHLPEDAAIRFRYPSVGGGAVEEEEFSNTDGRSYARPIPLPPSPTVIAQRILREQQDDEYLASLEADREKEVRAQLEEEARRSKEAEAIAAAHAEEKLRQEEELAKSLAAEEFERQIAAKRAGLPEEPSAEDEAAVTLMVRMPDGSRQGRRFRQSDHLQCLFDFIDVSGRVAVGSYRLVRQYPRKAFTDTERDSSLHDLGLRSKNEVLFLELI